jgi:hypothetical protein
MIAIGSDGLMSAIAKTRCLLQKNNAADIDGRQLPINCTGIASINSPMQCMMKEICAQCLQKHSIIMDGQKKEIYLYSCKQQDQNIDQVSFEHLSMRLRQNHLLEQTADQILNLQKKPL